MEGYHNCEHYIKFNNCIINIQYKSILKIFTYSQCFYNDFIHLTNEYIFPDIYELEIEKQKANLLIKTDINQAINEYDNILNDITMIEYNISNKKYDNKKQIVFLSKLNEIKKLILSNKSYAYTKLNKQNEAIDIDLFIISQIDSKFDKSYARLIQNYTKIGDLGKARFYVDELKVLFDEEIYKNKYKDIISDLEKKEQISHTNLKKFSKNSKKNEILTIKKQKAEENNKKWYILLNTFILSISGGALYYLIKNRKKFI